MPKKPVRKRPEQREKKLQYLCQQWLVKTGMWDRLLIFHVANERKGSIGTAMHFKRMGVRPGVADYLAFIPGKAIAIELKDDEGEQGKNQKVFQRKWEVCGNTYVVVRTLEEFKGVIDAIRLFA